MLPSGKERLPTDRNALIDSIDGIVWEADPRTLACSFVSAPAERLLGYPLTRWMNEPSFWLELLHPDDRERVLSDWVSAGQKLRHHRGDLRVRVADGRYLWMHAMVSTVTLERDAALLRGIMIDISERKALEESLRQSDAFLSAIYHSGDVGVFVVDVFPDGAYRYVGISPVHERLMRIKNAEVVGKGPRELLQHLGQESVDYIEALYARCIRERAPIESEFFIPEGPARGWWFSRLTPLFDERSARVTRLFGTALLIDGRKRAEAAVLESEERLRLAVQASNVGLWDWDVREQRVRYSREWKAQLGYAEHEISDDFEEWQRRVHPDDLGSTLARVQRTLEQPNTVHEAEFRMRHKDGTWRWIYTRATVQRDAQGVPLHFLGGHFDITDRKHAEAQIRRLASFPENNPNPVFEIAADGSLRYHNAAAEAMARELGYPHPSQLLPADIASIVRDCLATEQPRLRLETRHGNSTLSWSFCPVARSGAVHGYASDISERLRLEEQLRQSQKMDAIGHLAGGIAHDFNNLLTIIQGNVPLLHASERAPALRTEALEQITQATERATGLTRQLLAFSRRQELQARAVDLNETVRQLMTMLERLVGEDIQVDLQLSAAAPVVHADPGMLDQILMNLTINARDAMPRGGRLTFETTCVQLAEADRQRYPELSPGPYVRLSVADTGCGILPEHLDHVFEPFFTTKDVGKGTGLGLSMVFGIVKQHNGSIAVDSRLGHGTRFVILLPALDAIAAPDSEPPPSLSARGGHESILVVEDEAPLRRLVQRMLEMAGYRVYCAESGVDALTMYDRQGLAVDLVLTDVIMPGGMSGYDLAAQLCERRPRQRILYMSGYTGDAVGRHAHACCSRGLLQKPFTMSALLERIRNELDHDA